MKIGFFSDGYLPQPNGVATSVAGIADELTRLGHEVYIVAPKYPGYKDKGNVFRLTSVKLDEKTQIRLALTLPEKSLREVIKIDFDIIHGHAGGPITFLGWQIAKLKNIPFVGTYHTLWNRYTHYVFNGILIRPKAAEVASRVFCNLCDSIIAPTLRVKKELLYYGVKKPIVVIPSGLDLSRFGRASDRGFLRKKLKIPNTMRVLIYVGRLSREKSVDFLIESFYFVAQKNKESLLVLVGDGSLRKELEQLTAEKNLSRRVFFTGFVDHKKIPQVYVDSDIFVFSSETETQGLVVIEALASGLPVVAVKDEAFEGVVSDGKNGFLVPRDPKEFADKILELLGDADLYRRMSKEASNSAQEFSIEIAAMKTVRLYKKVIRDYKKKRHFTGKLKNLKNYLDFTASINRIKNVLISYGGKTGIRKG